MVHNESQQKSYFYEKELVDSAKHVMSQNDVTMYLLHYPLTKFALPKRSLDSLNSPHTEVWPVKGRIQPGYIKRPSISSALGLPKTAMFRIPLWEPPTLGNALNTCRLMLTTVYMSTHVHVDS